MDKNFVKQFFIISFIINMSITIMYCLFLLILWMIGTLFGWTINLHIAVILYIILINYYPYRVYSNKSNYFLNSFTETIYEEVPDIKETMMRNEDIF